MERLPNGSQQAEAAEIHDQDASLYGQTVRLDRRENKAWVDGEGLIRLPVKNDPNGKLLATARKLDVWWTERMVFDGLAANFYGDVRTILNDDHMYCDEMEVRFTKRFDFASAGGRGAVLPGATPKTANEPGKQLTETDPDRPDVAEVFCRHGVEVMGYEYEGEKLLSVRQAKFWQFHLDRTTGNTKAEGPGWIDLFRRGNGNHAGLAADNAVRANAPIQQESEQWEYLHVDFGGTSLGNINHRSNTFHDDVKVVYGPTKDPNHKLRPDELPPDAGWMTCQLLTVTQRQPTEPEAKPYTELIAEKNVRLEGRTF